MRILAIEDDPVTAREIIDELQKRGYSVDWARDGSDGLVRAMSGNYDAITLDRILPGVDGLVIIRTMRAMRAWTPVMILSALSHVDERVCGLRAGGDDYLAKPFDPEELAARLEVMLRRDDGATRESATLSLGALTMDLIARKLFCDGNEVLVLPTEFRILEFLLRHPERIVTRTMLVEALWGCHFASGSNLINAHIGRLCQRIDWPRAGLSLRTVRGVGYMLRTGAPDDQAA
ncbi:response regulator transcription factor [Massilia sp. METH4]|uniref:response regulator transcription factor n=1 Tax=Massilia sp. METH4 TaxID=3123041 RepID=UPI0030D29F47